MKKNAITYIAMILVVILLMLPLIVRFVHLREIERSYRGIDVSFKQTSAGQVRDVLEKQGIDTSMPGNGKSVLTFSAPISMTLQDSAFSPVTINYGDTLECDFVTWSHDFYRVRMAEISINGRQRTVKISTNQLTRLYVSALKQNGLQEQFQADTGKKLNFRSAKKAIKLLDQTLFEQGLHRAYDYPYDRRRVALIMGLSVLLALPLSGLLLTLLSIGYESVQYQIWLKQYNTQSIERWDKVAGSLPQFVSLQESGLKNQVPIRRKLRIRDRFLNMFRPVRPSNMK